MAIEFGPVVRQAVFRWLRREYHLTHRVPVPGAIVGRIDWVFRATRNRTIGIVGRNLEGGGVAGIGAFAWTTSEAANFEIAEGTLDGVILVVLVDDAAAARAARTDIAAFVANQVPPSLVNDTVIGYRQKKFKVTRFVPKYQERRIF